jgi:hypothetical protein
MSDPITVVPLSPKPILVEPIGGGAPTVVVVSGGSGPFGPVSMAVSTIAVTIDGQGTVIVPGDKADVPINWNGRITGWELLSDLAGGAVVSIKKARPLEAAPYASITNGDDPSLIAVAAAAGDALTWDADLIAGDALRISVVSLNTIRRLTVALFVERD